MFKKMILVFTLTFLLFEVLYYSSNNKAQDITYKSVNDVYEIAINDSDKEQFLNEYSNIILRSEDNKITVMTSKDIIQKIDEKYQAVID